MPATAFLSSLAGNTSVAQVMQEVFTIIGAGAIGGYSAYEAGGVPIAIGTAQPSVIKGILK